MSSNNWLSLLRYASLKYLYVKITEVFEIDYPVYLLYGLFVGRSFGNAVLFMRNIEASCNR